MDSTHDLHPPIHWGQNSKNVTLRIGLVAVKNPSIDIQAQKISFQASGCTGSRGEEIYSFELEFYNTIDAEASNYRINDREINITLKKRTDSSNANWPRLTKSSAKLPWLKADFDRMAFSEDESDEDKKQSMFKKFNNEKNYSFKPKDRRTETDGFINYRTNWLLFYNLFQFLAYLWVFLRLFVYGAFHGHFDNTYRFVENVIKLSQALSFLEIIHPIIGFTKGDWIAPFFQFCGRNFVLFVVINYNNDIQKSAIIAYLLMVWSFIELFRYPYYGLRVIEKDKFLLTWFRYSLWIFLYPLGAFLEGWVIYRSLQFYESTGVFTIELPNRWNFAFDFNLFLKFYLVLLPLALLQMMKYMSVQRVKALKTKKN